MGTYDREIMRFVPLLAAGSFEAAMVWRSRYLLEGKTIQIVTRSSAVRVPEGGA